MIRVAFKMKLKSGFTEEYKKRHDEIWPELVAQLKEAGVSDYGIFLDEETNILFAVQKLTENNTAAQLPEKEIVRKWWDYFSDILEYNPDNTPAATELKEMFYLP